MSFLRPGRLSSNYGHATRRDKAMNEAPRTAGQEATITRVHQVGNMPAKEYAQLEEGVKGFYDRLAEQLGRP